MAGEPQGAPGLRGGTGRHRDLKSRCLWACGFESRRGHHEVRIRTSCQACHGRGSCRTMGNAHPHRLYLPAGGRDEYRLWNLTGLRRDSETFGVVATLKPGISYAIFGALMWTSMGMCVLGFSSMDFSTKDRSSSWECGRYQLLSPCPPPSARRRNGPDPENIPEAGTMPDASRARARRAAPARAREAIRCPGPRRGAGTRRS